MRFKSISSDLLVTIVTLVAAFAAVTAAMAFQDQPSFRFDPYSYPDPYPDPYPYPYPYSLVRHVVPSDGMDNGECDSWATACDLQTAITIAISGDEIWVAAGTYIPHASDRTISFVLKNGVAIYGGFTGTETFRGQRDFTNNATILSGDLLGDDTDNVAHDEPTRAENSYHVLVGNDTDNSAVLDGFTVTGGNANALFYPAHAGGGMYNSNGSPELANITFSANNAFYGGGIYNMFFVK